MKKSSAKTARRNPISLVGYESIAPAHKPIVVDHVFHYPAEEYGEEKAADPSRIHTETYAIGGKWYTSIDKNGHEYNEYGHPSKLKENLRDAVPDSGVAARVIGTKIMAEAKKRAAARKAALVANPRLRRNSAERYEKVKALAERGSTEHERATAARILAGLRSPAQEARAALDAARAKQAQQVAAAYEVLHELRPGDKVEVIFEGKSLTSPDDKRTVTVQDFRDFGTDQRRYVFVTSGRVVPGTMSGGAIMDYGGGDLYFQPTIRTPVKRVVSLRVVGVAPKGAALLGAKANPKGKAFVRTKPVRMKGVRAQDWPKKRTQVAASVEVLTRGRPTMAGERGGLGAFTDIDAARRYIAHHPRGGEITPAVLNYRAKHAAERGYFSKTVLEKALEAEEISRGYVTSW